MNKKLKLLQNERMEYTLEKIKIDAHLEPIELDPKKIKSFMNDLDEEYKKTILTKSKKIT